MKYWLAFAFAAPFALAWGGLQAMCQGWFPTAGACPVGPERWSVYLSFLIMFAIAFWVGGGLMVALTRLRRDGGPDE